MKIFIVFLTLIGISFAVLTPKEEKMWVEYKIKFNKFFLSPGKETTRKQTFIQNAREISEHNERFENGEVTFQQRINQFTDMPEDVFNQRMRGTVVPDDFELDEPQKRITLRQVPPRSLDLRTRAGVMAVREQYPCGSCWAFSTASAIEYAYWLKTGITIDVSEQQMVDCVYEGVTDGCQGGWMPTAMEYASNGLYTEDQYPYTFAFEAGPCRAPNFNKYASTSSPSYSQIAADEVSIKNALAQYGVLSVCVDATLWQMDSIGIFASPNANGTLECNHAVALVGYDVNDTGIPYWIIRNSWGEDFADKGYIYLSALVLPNGNVAGGLLRNMVFAPILAND